MTSPAPAAHASAKLTRNADHTKALRAIQATDGVISAEPMFPGETDQELACLIVIVLDQEKKRRALSLLRRRPYIEYATPLADRKLIA